MNLLPRGDFEEKESCEHQHQKEQSRDAGISFTALNLY